MLTVRLVSSSSFNQTHIVPFFEVIYYLSLHLSHIQYKVDLMFPFLLQNHYQCHSFPHNHYIYHQRLQISIITHVFDLFYEIKENIFGGSKKPLSSFNCVMN
ncbi:hypothetical protein BpHYR1_043511 [Brachionus plicatilis]|uniref:Uncharacterized protein n=1 Tax=Brachionus plicatilis TaxID=10195 RepID=A0A3M7RK51_BRAPC|nr:hypothetical protein BpHYR1_043511 [Brachionus plicatilis]